MHDYWCIFSNAIKIINIQLLSNAEILRFTFKCLRFIQAFPYLFSTIVSNLSMYFYRGLILLYLSFIITFRCTHLLLIVVAAEKAHQNLLDGVEHFDKTQMKHTTTEEKNSLPAIEGCYRFIYRLARLCLKYLYFLF